VDPGPGAELVGGAPAREALAGSSAQVTEEDCRRYGSSGNGCGGDALWWGTGAALLGGLIGAASANDAERSPWHSSQAGDRVKPLPKSDQALVLRTDFSDDAAWRAIRSAIEAPVRDPGGTIDFFAYVTFVDDPEYRDLDEPQIRSLFGPELNQGFVIVVDRTAIAHREHPVLILDLFDLSSRTFRALPSTVQAIENNLSITNVDFEEFAAAADEDGVFRRFPSA
jgi:hypothetical protein